MTQTAVRNNHKPILIALGGMIAIAAAMGIGRFVYTPILPFMIENGGLSKAAGGWIAAANYLGYLLGALLAASSAISGDKRLWFIAGLALSAATTGAMGLTQDPWLYAGLRLLGGVASAVALLFASALVLDRLAQAGRGGLSSLYFSGVGIGVAVSAVLVGGLGRPNDDGAGLWFWSAAITGLAAAAAWVLIPGERNRAAQPPPPRQEGETRGLGRLFTAYFTMGFGYVITATFLSTLARETPSLAAYETVLWLTVGLAAAPSVLFWNWVARLTTVLRAYALASLTLALGVALSVLSQGPVLVLAAAVMLGGTIMGLTALAMVEARRVTRGDPRRAIALLTAAFGVGQMIGPAFAGLLFEATGSLTAPSLCASALLVLGAALTWKPLPEPPSQTAPLDGARGGD
ncbi:MAG: YbfB/YjiJ family MFS transporter [Alphaproteobacteria bacterium]|nr:YbfB/YjiJ family MFS transporter [Alphaproteobacteria bacterium]